MLAIRRTSATAAVAAITTALRSSHALTATVVLISMAAVGYGFDDGEFSAPAGCTNIFLRLYDSSCVFDVLIGYTYFSSRSGHPFGLKVRKYSNKQPKSFWNCNSILTLS